MAPNLRMRVQQSLLKLPLDAPLAAIALYFDLV